MSLTYEQIWIRFRSLANASINAYKDTYELARDKLDCPKSTNKLGFAEQGWQRRTYSLQNRKNSR